MPSIYDNCLDICKKSLRVTTTAYDSELQSYIEAAMLDLSVAGVCADISDALVRKAVLTYVRKSFGSPKDYDKLKESYDEQKGTLMNATGYTDWSAR